MYDVYIVSEIVQYVLVELFKTIKYLNLTELFLIRYRSNEGFKNSLKSAKLNY